MTSKKIPYSIVDVFTKTPFLGNPVAVIHDATALSASEMQSITTEFGFSESTFVLPSNKIACAARVRIFTPLTEIPFAGHPNIGTAFTIATQNTVAATLEDGECILDELGGEVAVKIEFDDGVPAGARITAPQSLEILGECETGLLARCLGLPVDQVTERRVKPCVASVGLPFAFAEVKDIDTLSRISVSTEDFQKAKDAGPETVDGFALCAFARVDETADAISLRSRVLCPLGVPPEDPATGSASGALAALISPCDRTTDYCVRIEQGVEMGRASQITVNMKSGENRPEILGHCVTISTGEIHL